MHMHTYIERERERKNHSERVQHTYIHTYIHTYRQTDIRAHAYRYAACVYGIRRQDGPFSGGSFGGSFVRNRRTEHSPALPEIPWARVGFRLCKNGRATSPSTRASLELTRPYRTKTRRALLMVESSNTLKQQLAMHASKLSMYI